MKSLLWMAAIILLVSFTSKENNYSDKNKRAYIEGAFYYEFSIVTSNPKIKFDKDVEYYWYKLNKIHSSYYDVAGRLLHGAYQKTHLRNKKLIEKGIFKNGLKDGKWKVWYENGKLKTITSWNSGKKEGWFLSYNYDGKLQEKGNYKQNNKNGTWINYVAKDTTHFNSGDIKVPKVKKKKEEKLLYKIFHKKDSISKLEIKKKRKQKKAENKSKKGFFRRLFDKD